jgi:hypothetical protein
MSKIDELKAKTGKVRDEESRGSGLVPGGGEDSGKEEEFRQSRNRDENVGKGKGKVKFDKEKHPLEKSGHWFRKDHLKLYKIHAALKGCSRQELINKALEYYKVNVLQKSEAQKLKEAGQEELGI